VSMAAARTIDALRSVGRNGRREVGGEDIVEYRPDESAGPGELARQSEIGALLEGEIASLPSKESYILRLSVEHDLTHAQISELMDIPRDTVSSSIRRSKEKIREALRTKGISEI